MKKTISVLISLVTIISMLSSSAVSAIEKMSKEQINAVYDDFNKNYFMKTYTTDDWIYEPTLTETWSFKDDKEEGDLIYLEIVYEITKFKNENATSVVIPNSIDGHKIFFVSDLTFKNNPNLEKVTYSNGIGGVASYTFNNHKKLKKVVLPTSIKSLGSKAFSNCESLKNVILPKNVKIEKMTFKNCKSLKTFKYKGTTNKNEKSYVLKEAFANCVNLESIDLGNNKLIDKSAFYNCKSLKSVTIPKNTEVIHNKAFYNCKSLSKVTFKNSKKAPDFGKNSFKNTKKGIKFVVKNKKVAKSLKKKLKGTSVKNAKILIGKNVVYQNING